MARAVNIEVERHDSRSTGITITDENGRPLGFLVIDATQEGMRVEVWDATDLHLQTVAVKS